MEITLEELEERLERQKNRRDKEIARVGFASKQITDKVSRTTRLIELKKQEGMDKN